MVLIWGWEECLFPPAQRENFMTHRELGIVHRRVCLSCGEYLA